ncbi:MAG: serine hydroxymethyltransferase, partial [Chloroflexota bacterium]|nr:serine hydroxymethyltransferase [Chloroflexota bacterium]
AHIAGLVAAGCHPSPVGHAHVVTSSTHKTLRGPRGGFVLCDAAFANKIDKAVFPGMQGGPLMHVIAAKAVAFQEALLPEFAYYQQAVVDNASTLAQELTSLGFRLVSGGTDNHLVLVDLRSINITGRDAELALERACISVNRNSIPFDPLPPNVTSGIRLGTPAVTTRGLGRSEMKEIARMISRVLSNLGNDEVLAEVCQQVEGITREFPVPKLVCRA